MMTKDEIIFYMIRRNIDATIKDYLKEIKDIDDDPAPIIPVKAAPKARKVEPDEPIPFVRDKGVYSNVRVEY